MRRRWRLPDTRPAGNAPDKRSADNIRAMRAVVESPGHPRSVAAATGDIALWHSAAVTQKCRGFAKPAQPEMATPIRSVGGRVTAQPARPCGVIRLRRPQRGYRVG